MGGESIKRELLQVCDSEPSSEGDEQRTAEVKRLIDELIQHNPIAKPLSASEFDGRWQEAYSSLGVRYARGRPLRGEFDLKQLSFGKLGSVPVQLDSVHQEVDRASCAYNNVIDFHHAETGTQGRVTMYGRFSVDGENPQRANVNFYAVQAMPVAGEDAAKWQESLGLGGDRRHDLRPPKLHSDVVYLDADTRINFGSVGGVYVLRQTPESPVSW